MSRSRSESSARRGSHQLLAHPRHRLAGDHNAANIVLKCIARRCTVLGFDRPDNRTDTTASMVVIGGTTGEYVNGVQAIVDQHERGRRQTPSELRGG